MKMLAVKMKNNSTRKTVYVNPDKIECLIPLEEGCRILFPYLSQDGDICHMDVAESAASIVKQMDSL